MEVTTAFALPTNVEPIGSLFARSIVLGSSWYPTSVISYITLRDSSDVIALRLLGEINNGVVLFSEIYPRSAFLIDGI